MNLKKNYLLAVVRLAAISLWIMVMPVTFMIARLLRIHSYKQLPHLFHRGTCFILGIDVAIQGNISSARPTLYVSNHVSYIDIFVLGRLPAYFIAKSEVAEWPVFGQLARFQNTLFIERKRGKAKAHLEVLQKHLQQENSLILFPEGTSTNGTYVEPFKSSLFEAANLGAQQRVAIQPVTVCYTHYNGEKIIEQSVRDYYAWYAKMPFLAHFLRLFPLRKMGAKVHFHPVCYLEDFETRKLCADHCQKLVADKLEQLMS